MTHTACRLTAKNRDQLRNPMLGHSHKPTLPQVIATKSKCNHDLHQRSLHIKNCHQIVPNSCSTQILEWRTKTSLLQFFPRLHRIPRVLQAQLPSVLWRCWLGIRKGIWPVKIEWWGIGVVTCLEWGADCLHMVQLIPLPSQDPIVSGFTSLNLNEARDDGVLGCSGIICKQSAHGSR